MTAKNEQFDPQVIATTIMGVVQDTFEKMCHASFSKPPEFVEKKIIEYNSKMRVFGLEKFNGPCYASVINFYVNLHYQEKKETCGTFVLYVEEDIALRMLKELGYTGFNEEDEDLIKDSCGEFGNVIAGNFKNELKEIGYSDLIISAPTTYKNDIPDGVDFPYSQDKLCEIGFYLWKEKAIVIDMTMAAVPTKN